MTDILAWTLVDKHFVSWLHKSQTLTSEPSAASQLTGDLLLFGQLRPGSFLLLFQLPVSVRQGVFVGPVRQGVVLPVAVQRPGHVHCL